MPSLTWKKANLKVSINSARNVYEEITKKIKIKKNKGNFRPGRME